MSLPISVGMLSTFLFQVVDTYFVGKLGPDSLAALSFSSVIYFLLVGLFIGFSVGVSIIIGKAIGEQNVDKVAKTIRLSFVVCFILTTVLSVSGVIFMDSIFYGLGANAVIAGLISEYMVPLLTGIPLLTLGILSGSILRATGNSTAPEVIMAIAGIINLIFDYILIFGKFGFPEMGIQGAAYATVLSWVFVIVGMAVLLIKSRLIRFGEKAKNSTFDIIKEIFKLGLPTIITQIIGPATLIYLTFLIAQQSALAVAAFGVVGKIEMLLMIGILAVSTAITPFIAQNYGAKQQGRIDEAIAFGGRASTYLGLLVSILLILFITPIAALFSSDELVMSHTSSYFYLVSPSYVFYGLFLVTSSIFNGLELPVNSLKINMVKSLFITVPLPLAGSFWGVNGIFIGISLGNILAGIYSAMQMRKEFKHSRSPLASVNVWQEYKNDFKRMTGKSKR